jgi:hypothetical protein
MHVGIRLGICDGDMIHIALPTDCIVVSSTLLLFDTKSFEKVSGRVRACCDAAAAGLSRAAKCFLVSLTALMRL